MIGGTNSGGGGLNLRIVDGNTQPPSPVENLIWINTETRIPNWYWQADEPTEKETGTLWIGSSSVSSNVLSLLRHNVLEVGIGTIRQWNGTEWEIVGGKVYYDGTWHNFQTFVYDGSIGDAEQNFNHDVGGYPWRTSASVVGGSISTAADSFTGRFNTSAGGAGHGVVYSNEKIDFTDVSKAKITLIATSSGRVTVSRAGVFASASSGRPSDVKTYIGAGGSAIHTVELDTSGVTGSYYLGFYCASDVSVGTGWGVTYKIYSIELIS